MVFLKGFQRTHGACESQPKWNAAYNTYTAPAPAAQTASCTWCASIHPSVDDSWCMRNALRMDEEGNRARHGAQGRAMRLQHSRRLLVTSHATGAERWTGICRFTIFH
mmetsp:Transcript_32712/g.81022  ORF Transcript_32712/g.81022 Transcript_32712/m.81022 type:complete len:108 (-) Transcript_32712:25-348(-)